MVPRLEIAAKRVCRLTIDKAGNLLVMLKGPMETEDFGESK